MREMCRRAAVIMCLVVSETEKMGKKHKRSGGFDWSEASLGLGWKLQMVIKVIKKTSHLMV